VAQPTSYDHSYERSLRTLVYCLPLLLLIDGHCRRSDGHSRAIDWRSARWGGERTTVGWQSSFVSREADRRILVVRATTPVDVSWFPFSCPSMQIDSDRGGIVSMQAVEDELAACV
jgi:hypothetical protein